jgi:hypothetical protein
MMSTRLDSRSERGQILVIVAAGMVVFLAMVALVIDGGNAWAQQRDTQNGTDAAAEAGATVLALNLPFKAAGEALPNSDAEVLAAVDQFAAQNNIERESAVYTDFDGTELGIEVGSLGAGDPPDDADGVKVVATKEFDTFLAAIMGFSDLLARTDATAHAGYVVQMPAGAVLPLTVPVTVPLCDGSNNLITTTEQWVPGEEYIIYLCSNGPGNVGWLDWTPPGGGCSETASSIEQPDSPPLTIPDWHYVVETGNCNSSQVQSALEGWIGRSVSIPLFDATCDTKPPGATDLCSTGPGHGSNQYYHFNAWIDVVMESVHVNGGNSACMASNGSTGCIIATVQAVLGPGVLGEPLGNESPVARVGVELID